MVKPAKTEEDSDRRRIAGINFYDAGEKTELRVTWRKSIRWRNVVKKAWWYVAFPVGSALAILRHFDLL